MVIVPEYLFVVDVCYFPNIQINREEPKVKQEET